MLWPFKRVLARRVGALVERHPGLQQDVAAAIERRWLAVELERLRRGGVWIDVLHDIGARRGEWTEPAPGSSREPASTSSTRAARRCPPAYLYETAGTGDWYYRESADRYAGLLPRRVATGRSTG